MISDDMLYLLLLLVSILLGLLFSNLGPLWKRNLSTLSGLAILFLVSGIHGVFCLICFLLQVVMINLCPENVMHVVSFVVQFGYLLFFRFSDQILPSVTPYPPQTNAIQMILTLKMIGVAFEIFDSRQQRKVNPDSEEAKLLQNFRSVSPSTLDLFHYAFSHIGFLTGPYYKFRTFQDLHNEKFSQVANCKMAVLRRIKVLPLYILLFLVSDFYFPIKAVESDEFYETTTFWYRVFYVSPVFFNFRMRLYCGFVLSECSCISAGLGAYPSKSKPRSGNGPTDLKALQEIKSKQTKDQEEYDFETVHNIDEYGAEFVSTMREALRTWNMTVQFWLANIVYKRFPFKSVRTLAVMIVSSVWHGIYSGYYLSLGSVPFILMVEDLYSKIMRRNLSEKGQKSYDWISWFMRMQWFSYLGMAFRLLRIDSTLKFWHSIGYLGHTILPIFYLLGVYFVKPLFFNQNFGRKETKIE